MSARRIRLVILASGNEPAALNRRGHSPNRRGLGNGRIRAAPNDHVKTAVALTKKRPPPICRGVIGMFNRLVIARIAPYFPPVGFAPPARQRRHGPSSGNGFPEKIVLSSNRPDGPRVQGMMG